MPVAFLKSSAALLSQSYHLYPFSLLSWRACPLYGGLDVKRKIVPQATRPLMPYSSGRCDGSTIYFDLMRVSRQGVVTPVRRPGTFKNLKNNIWLYINSNFTSGFLLTARQSQNQPGATPLRAMRAPSAPLRLLCLPLPSSPQPSATARRQSPTTVAPGEMASSVRRIARRPPTSPAPGPRRMAPSSTSTVAYVVDGQLIRPSRSL
jgi:hypothetical protein